VSIFLISRGDEKSFVPDSCRRCEGEQMSLVAAWRDRKSLDENDIFKIVKNIVEILLIYFKSDFKLIFNVYSFVFLEKPWKKV